MTRAKGVPVPQGLTAFDMSLQPEPDAARQIRIEGIKPRELTGVTKPNETFDRETDLAIFSEGIGFKSYRRRQVIFSQGAPADAVFYVQKGRVKLTVVSKRGKEVTVALLGAEDFFGEGCLAGQLLRTATATAIEDATVLRLSKKAMEERLHADLGFSERFTTYLLSRNVRFEEDLIDQLFNSSEKRLARLLLLLARSGRDGKARGEIPKVSQQTLAEMIGTTRPRVNYFLNKFRRLGFIDYHGRIQVHDSLFDVLRAGGGGDFFGLYD